MSEQLVDTVREEDYLLKVFSITKDSMYTKLTTNIIKSVKSIYRIIEPSHFKGKLIVYMTANDSVFYEGKISGEKLYDYSIINHNYESIVIQFFQSGDLPLIYSNISDSLIDELISSSQYVAYKFEDDKEYVLVNANRIKIINKYSCPSIFALQYHFLNEEILRYKNERVQKVSCEHFKNCWYDKNHLYFVNKPEDSIQLSISEFLKNSLRGVDIVREYMIGASKPVDIRVYWREANRAALIEVKLMGRSVKPSGEINTYEYDNKRANEGMDQIKEYIDKAEQDTPSIINKGYLIVVDGRRRGVNPKVTSVTRSDGMHYSNQELEIDSDKKYWETHYNIEKPIRMFVEPNFS